MRFRFITFLTNFGLQDDFVGTCHGVIKRIAPDVEVIDITHGIEPRRLLQGALTLADTIPYMPVGVHLAVVDPGVGTDRRAVALEDESGRVYVGPDNGLLLPVAERMGGIARVHQITNRKYSLEDVSPTFHGRDVFSRVLYGGQIRVTPAEKGLIGQDGDGRRPVAFVFHGDPNGVEVRPEQARRRGGPLHLRDEIHAAGIGLRDGGEEVPRPRGGRRGGLLPSKGLGASASETANPRSPAIASRVISSRCSKLAVDPSCLSGCAPTGAKSTASSRNASRAARATARWPRCGGSKLPPKNATRDPLCQTCPLGRDRSALSGWFMASSYRACRLRRRILLLAAAWLIATEISKSRARGAASA